MRRSGDYRVLLPGTDTVLSWDPFAVERARYPGFLEIDYLAGVFRAYERSDPLPTTFLVTWNVDRLPAIEGDVVVVLLGDEWCRAPRYAADVTAVLRTYCDRPVLTIDRARPARLNALDIAQFVRSHLLGAPQRIVRAGRRLGGALPAPTHLLPLGYAHQLDLPLIDPAERDMDLFFVGSMRNLEPSWWSARRWIGTPKDVTRSRMLRFAHDVRRRRPDLNIVLETTAQFSGNVTKNGDAFDRAAVDYSHKMMRTRLALVPRGTSPDTYRLFEALRYGCVPITDRLPTRWYYERAPVVEVGDWSELPAVVERLTRDPAEVRRLHVAARSFWDDCCSEDAVGTFLADRLAPARDLAVAAAGSHPTTDGGRTSVRR